MTMDRRIFAGACILLTHLSFCQNLGLVGGLQRSIWRSGGHVAEIRSRAELGLFTAYQLHTNVAIRNEVALGFRLGDHKGGVVDRIRLNALLRVYPSPIWCFTGGIDGSFQFHRGAGEESSIARQKARFNLSPVLGAGFRLSGRSELGLRAGVGLLSKVDLGIYGQARDHQVSIIYGYLITGKLPGFTKRRMWRKHFKTAADNR